MGRSQLMLRHSFVNYVKNLNVVLEAFNVSQLGKLINVTKERKET